MLDKTEFPYVGNRQPIGMYEMVRIANKIWYGQYPKQSDPKEKWAEFDQVGLDVKRALFLIDGVEPQMFEWTNLNARYDVYINPRLGRVHVRRHTMS